MGSLLLAFGLEPGDCPEVFNVEKPDLIARIHRDYVGAGADLILTNTFGGTDLRLGHFGFETRVDELNQAGVAIAREVVDAAPRPVAVAGSVGPTGRLFAPLGPLDPQTAFEAFSTQIGALKTAGVDVVWIETMSSMEELAAAYEAAASTGLPVVTTMSFDTKGRTMMGVPPERLANWATGMSTVPAAIGANCGIGSADVTEAVRKMHDVVANLPLVAKANCGLPVLSGSSIEYPEQPGDMATYVTAAIRAGARIIGTCCGSTPSHIAAIRAAVDARQT
jgi:5-methyltetrahydrofolate--homocysteine methyltransferase